MARVSTTLLLTIFLFGIGTAAQSAEWKYFAPSSEIAEKIEREGFDSIENYCAENAGWTPENSGLKNPPKTTSIVIKSRSDISIQDLINAGATGFCSGVILLEATATKYSNFLKSRKFQEVRESD